jgi:diphthamide biosynthesis protein 7
MPTALVAAVSRSSVDTDYSADSLEFSPHHPAIFAVGTYQLEKPAEESGTPSEPEPMAGYDDDGNMIATPAAKRRGRCLVYETDVAGRLCVVACRTAARRQLNPLPAIVCSTEKHRVEGPAILDMKWCVQPAADNLAQSRG